MENLKPPDLFALVALFERGTWTMLSSALPLVKHYMVPTIKQMDKNWNHMT